MIGSPARQAEEKPSVEASEESNHSEHSSITSFGRRPPGGKSSSSSSSSGSSGPGGGGTIAPPPTIASPRSLSNEVGSINDEREEDVRKNNDDVVIDIPETDNEPNEEIGTLSVWQRFRVFSASFFSYLRDYVLPDYPEDYISRRTFQEIPVYISQLSPTLDLWCSRFTPTIRRSFSCTK